MSKRTSSFPPTTHTIEDLLDENHGRFSPLQRLIKTASNQKQWTAEFCALLDPSLHRSVQVTNIRGPVLHLLCDNAAVATRLRFVLADLLPQLRQLQSFSGVTDTKIRVASR
ncbi:MAG: DciA family protein [Pseudomonadota bacterium]